MQLMEKQNILIVGSGGREHALAWKCLQSPWVQRIYCAPGNPGLGRMVETVDIAVNDIAGLVQFVGPLSAVLAWRALEQARDHGVGRIRVLDDAAFALPVLRASALRLGVSPSLRIEAERDSLGRGSMDEVCEGKCDSDDAPGDSVSSSPSVTVGLEFGRCEEIRGGAPGIDSCVALCGSTRRADDSRVCDGLTISLFDYEDVAPLLGLLAFASGSVTDSTHGLGLVEMELDQYAKCLASIAAPVDHTSFDLLPLHGVLAAVRRGALARQLESVIEAVSAATAPEY